MLSTSQRVANGIKFLNKNYPNWVQQIDINNINLCRSDRCIIGQITNAARFNPILHNPDNGFDFYKDEDRVNSDLVEQWIVRIKELRK